VPLPELPGQVERELQRFTAILGALHMEERLHVLQPRITTAGNGHATFIGPVVDVTVGLRDSVVATVRLAAAVVSLSTESGPRGSDPTAQAAPAPPPPALSPRSDGVVSSSAPSSATTISSPLPRGGEGPPSEQSKRASGAVVGRGRPRRGISRAGAPLLAMVVMGAAALNGLLLIGRSLARVTARATPAGWSAGGGGQ
jgi:hypothetical protein